MRNPATSGGVFVLCLLASLAAQAAQVEYAFPGAEPPRVTVNGGGQSYPGYRLNPGGQLTATVHGPGVLRLLFFADCGKGGCPSDLKLMLTLGGQGKMNDLAPQAQPGGSYSPAPKDKATPSAPLAIILKVEDGDHPLVAKLPGGAGAGGVLSFSNAVKKGAGDDLDLDFAPVASNTKKPSSSDLDLPDLDMDLEPVPAKPAKGGKPPPPAKGASANLDLDLDFAPAAPPPAKGQTPPAKGQTQTAANLDLDLDFPAPPPATPVVAANPPKAGKPPEPAKPTETIVAQKPKQPPPKPPSTSVLVATNDEPKPAPPPKRKKKRPEVVQAPPQPVEPPVQLGRIELGPKAGYALARGRLAGQGVYMLEFGYRLASTPEVRVTVNGGYTMLTGSWSGIEPGRGLGTFTQQTAMVPVEVGATYEPTGPGGFSPYFGLSFSTGYMDTTLKRFSLKGDEVQGSAVGATASLGLRLQAGSGSFVVELRHTESIGTLASLSKLGQATLSSSAVAGGYLFSF